MMTHPMSMRKKILAELKTSSFRQVAKYGGLFNYADEKSLKN